MKQQQHFSHTHVNKTENNLNHNGTQRLQPATSWHNVLYSVHTYTGKGINIYKHIVSRHKSHLSGK